MSNLFKSDPNAPDAANFIENLGFTATVATNALTFALTTGSGGSISSANPVQVGFRSATATSGTYNFRTLTAAPTSLVIPASTTIGTTNGTQTFIYLYAMDSAGTVLLACSLTLFDEGTVKSSSAISGGSSASTLYSTAAQTSLPIRLIGRITVTEATAGTWATAPAEVAVGSFPGVTFPNAVVGSLTVTGNVTVGDGAGGDQLAVGGPSGPKLTDDASGSHGLALDTGVFYPHGTSYAGLGAFTPGVGFLTDKTLCVKSAASALPIVVSAVPSVDGLMIVRGKVTIGTNGSAAVATCTLTYGEGFTASVVAATARVTFSTAFGTAPVCVTTIDNTGATAVTVWAVASTSSTTILELVNIGALANSTTYVVHFIAIGQRGS